MPSFSAVEIGVHASLSIDRYPALLTEPRSLRTLELAARQLHSTLYQLLDTRLPVMKCDVCINLWCLLWMQHLGCCRTRWIWFQGGHKADFQTKLVARRFRCRIVNDHQLLLCLA